MLALADAQQAVATIAVFIATFLVTLSIGRLLKRRAGVPFGIFFQLFALALGFYAAAWVYGIDLRWRNHAGAALVLLSAAVVIALVDRYLWDLYFEQRRQTVIPKFLREMVALVIFLIALLLVLELRLSRGNSIARPPRDLRRRRHHPRLCDPESPRRCHRRHVAANQQALQSGRLAPGRRTLCRGHGDQLALDPAAHERRHLPRHPEQRDRPPDDHQPALSGSNCTRCGSWSGSITTFRRTK